MEQTSLEVEKGRQAFDRGSWRIAHDALAAAGDDLIPADHWRLAISSYLVGRESEFLRAMQLAHQAYLESRDTLGAARCAFWLGFHLINRGEVAQATGWFGRAARILEDHRGESPERGLLLVPMAFRQLTSGAAEAGARTAAEAVEIGKQCRDPDLLALALHVQGRALLRLSRVEEGLALLDEAMVAVATGEVSPHVTGLVYCSVIGACREVWAVRRAHEWTAALSEWCERQPDMVPYAGECRAYRAEILQLHGDWGEALDEARRAVEHLAAGPQPRLAAFAHYQLGELHRLRGELAAAEEAYRAASRLGREPQPGLALLRLAQGDRQAASAAIRRALAETADSLERARLLPAHIEVMLEVGEVEEARRACAELAEAGRRCATGFSEALVAQASGAVELSAGNPGGALAPLRHACRGWEALGAPYNAARVRVLIGLACRELGDEDGATLELEAARAELERLGAAPDVSRIDALSRRAVQRGPHGLTPREREVLSRIATGRTNRAIAKDLAISDKTVARHVANIFTKLGLSSRAAATAYAFRHDLVDPST